MRRAILVKNDDNVATATTNLSKGEELDFEGGTMESVKLKDEIPLGHKFAVVGIEKGENIIKYGEIIGESTENIGRGEYVHIHNVESKRGRGDRS